MLTYYIKHMSSNSGFTASRWPTHFHRKFLKVYNASMLTGWKYHPLSTFSRESDYKEIRLLLKKCFLQKSTSPFSLVTSTTSTTIKTNSNYQICQSNQLKSHFFGEILFYPYTKTCTEIQENQWIPLALYK